MRIGKKVSLCSGIRFMALSNFSIGDNSVINRNCLIDNRKNIIIGSNVSIAEGVKIFTMGHDVDDVEFALKGTPVIIGNYVCIFAYSMLMPGVVLGDGVVVYPGSIVTHDFECLSVIAGIPAKFLRLRNCSLNYELDANYLFN
jgi:acetyltransferase-like isoleucine patch superfamily enzyme